MDTGQDSSVDGQLVIAGLLGVRGLVTGLLHWSVCLRRAVPQR